MPVNSSQGATPFIPEKRTLAVLAEAVQKRHGCDLYRNATQAVFGELETGFKSTKPGIVIMMIGEQPGDQEDKVGKRSQVYPQAARIPWSTADTTERQ
jgi:hypothetical protein